MTTSGMELRSPFAAMDVASGVTISNCYRRHRHQEFQHILIEESAWAKCARGALVWGSFFVN
jgi:hypothetical protein